MNARSGYRFGVVGMIVCLVLVTLAALVLPVIVVWGALEDPPGPAVPGEVYVGSCEPGWDVGARQGSECP